MPLLFLLNFFVHSAGVILTDIVRNHQNFYRNGAGTHGDLQFVAYLNIVAGLDHTAVDTDAAVIAGFVGYGPTLDQSGYF